MLPWHINPPIIWDHPCYTSPKQLGLPFPAQSLLNRSQQSTSCSDSRAVSAKSEAVVQPPLSKATEFWVTINTDDNK